jgi:hypothetical protein
MERSSRVNLLPPGFRGTSPFLDGFISPMAKRAQFADGLDPWQEQAFGCRSVRHVAAQAVERPVALLGISTRDRVVRDRMAAASSGIETNFSRLVIGFQVERLSPQQRHRFPCRVDLHVGLARDVTAHAKRVGLGAGYAREVARVGIMADCAVPFLERAVHDGVWFEVVASAAKFTTPRHERYCGFAVLGYGPMAAVATLHQGRMDKFPLFLSRMAA